MELTDKSTSVRIAGPLQPRLPSDGNSGVTDADVEGLAKAFADSADGGYWVEDESIDTLRDFNTWGETNLPHKNIRHFSDEQIMQAVEMMSNHFR